jgi:hypothetical protein
MHSIPCGSYCKKPDAGYFLTFGCEVWSQTPELCRKILIGRSEKGRLVRYEEMTKTWGVLLKSGHIVIRRNCRLLEATEEPDTGLDWAKDAQTGADNDAGAGRGEDGPHEYMSDADASKRPRSLGRHSQLTRLNLRLNDSCHSGHEHIPSVSWTRVHLWHKEMVFQMNRRHWTKHCTRQTALSGVELQTRSSTL